MISSKNLTELQKLIPEIKQFAVKHSDPDDLHGLGHVNRVLHNANLIAQKEGGQIILIEAMVWFHDIGRKYESEKKKHHALLSVEMARDFLSCHAMDKEIINSIGHGIQTHSFSVGNQPESLEGKILSDADKLDALGAVGIFRTCAFQHENKNGIKSVLDHIDNKLLKLPELLYLPTSKRLAQILTHRLLIFKKELLEELTD